MAVFSTWLARAFTLLVLTLRSAADGKAKSGASSLSAAPLRQTLTLLGVAPGVDDFSMERRLQAQSQPIDLLAVDTLRSVPTSKCSQNTFFLDWGSSGMKVHAVHSSPVLAKEHADVKIVGLGPKVAEEQLYSILGNLSAKLTFGHVGGAAIATAGFRLLPSSASTTWQRVRKWNLLHGLLQNCSVWGNTGCRTLAGSDEADYEMQGMVDSLHRDHKDLGARFGMASCGGASIQLAFWGLPEKELADCVRDLNGFSAHYDKARTKLGVKRQAAWFSWLANHRVDMSIAGRSDYSVGGVDEMRERYDSWLELEQGAVATNPCVSSEVDAYFTKGGKCESLAGTNRSCLLDRWGSYITRLKGRPDSTREICRESITTFLQEDQMLSTWHTSPSCRALAMQTPEWNFLTAFSRPTQLGANLKKSKTWGEVKQCTRKFGSTPMFESKQDLKDEMPGEYLTSALLIGFLDRLGLNDSATIRPSKGDVAESVMKHFGLYPGWISEDQAECTRQFTPLPTHSPYPIGSCTLPDELQVMGQRLRRDFFDPNSTITVACSAGFTGSQPTWLLMCVDGNWKDAAASPGAVKETAQASTLCRRVTCEAPNVDFGWWFVPDNPGGNQTFYLRCYNGYKPVDGQSVLTCLDGGILTSSTRCAPIGDAGAWRSKNIIMPGLTDFILLAACGGALAYVAMHISRSKQKPTADRQETRPIIPPTAEIDME